MDTSKEYIKMCEKAVEIQNQCKPYLYGNDLIPDVFANIQNTTLIIGSRNEINGYIWLPRQDQLQEMISVGRARKLLLKFTDWVEYKTEEGRQTMEQLWLAFVMIEEHNKTWDGENWFLCEK